MPFYRSNYIRTKIFPSFHACISNATNVQTPPRTITVPLNRSAPVNPPFSLVTKAPAIGVPVKVLSSTCIADGKLRKRRHSGHHPEHCPYFPHVWTDLSTTWSEQGNDRPYHQPYSTQLYIT